MVSSILQNLLIHTKKINKNKMFEFIVHEQNKRCKAIGWWNIGQLQSNKTSTIHNIKYLKNKSSKNYIWWFCRVLNGLHHIYKNIVFMLSTSKSFFKKLNFLWQKRHPSVGRRSKRREKDVFSKEKRRGLMHCEPAFTYNINGSLYKHNFNGPMHFSSSRCMYYHDPRPQSRRHKHVF